MRSKKLLCSVWWWKTWALRRAATAQRRCPRKVPKLKMCCIENCSAAISLCSKRLSKAKRQKGSEKCLGIQRCVRALPASRKRCGSEVSFNEELAAWKEANGNPCSCWQWRGKKRPNDAWPEAQAPRTMPISQGIANRIDSELAALRLAVFSARALDGTRRGGPRWPTTLPNICCKN